MIIFVIIGIIIIIIVRIKYRLFAGQGEGKSFTDPRQVKTISSDEKKSRYSCFTVNTLKQVRGAPLY